MKKFLVIKYILVFLVFRHDLFRCIDFTRIADSKAESDEFTN